MVVRPDHGVRRVGRPTLGATSGRGVGDLSVSRATPSPVRDGYHAGEQRREPSQFGSSISREGGMGRERFGAGRP